MLVHSIVPHHHHQSLGEATEHHIHEHTNHVHEHGESHGHDHTAHFVHSPDFGNELVSPKKIFGPDQLTTLVYLFLDVLKLDDVDLLPSVTFFPEEPPPDYNYYASSFSLRGPPSMIV